MRKPFSIAAAALVAATTLAVPASPVSAAGQASGFCGQAAGVAAAQNSLFPDLYSDFGKTVPAIFYTVNYSGLDAPTTLGVIIRYNDELDTQVGLASGVATGSGGSFAGRFGSPALIEPQTQGGGVNVARGGGAGGSNKAKAFRGGTAVGGGNTEGGPGSSYTNGHVSSRKNRREGQPTSGYAGGGGITPGEYAFYVYTGEMRDTPEGRRFFADEKNFLGKFSCAVEDDPGKE